MTLITDRKEFFKQALKDNCKVMEVTIKKYYVTYPHESLTEEEIEKEWFGDFLNRSHAYKDGSHIGNADKLVEVKFFKKDEKEGLKLENGYQKYTKDDKETHPTEYGKYQVYREGCDKVAFETWNNTGWAYNNNDITHWKEIEKP